MRKLVRLISRNTHAYANRYTRDRPIARKMGDQFAFSGFGATERERISYLILDALDESYEIGWKAGYG